MFKAALIFLISLIALTALGKTDYKLIHSSLHTLNNTRKDNSARIQALDLLFENYRNHSQEAKEMILRATASAIRQEVQRKDGAEPLLLELIKVIQHPCADAEVYGQMIGALIEALGHPKPEIWQSAHQALLQLSDYFLNFKISSQLKTVTMNRLLPSCLRVRALQLHEALDCRFSALTAEEWFDLFADPNKDIRLAILGWEGQLALHHAGGMAQRLNWMSQALATEPEAEVRIALVARLSKSTHSYTVCKALREAVLADASYEVKRLAFDVLYNVGAYSAREFLEQEARESRKRDFRLWAYQTLNRYRRKHVLGSLLVLKDTLHRQCARLFQSE